MAKAKSGLSFNVNAVVLQVGAAEDQMGNPYRQAALLEDQTYAPFCAKLISRVKCGSSHPWLFYGALHHCW
jgi:hypothetical protein